jgi:NarL family two-component system response regulator YdfI
VAAAKPIRVVIADDHLVVREGLRLILETTDELEVVGEAADGAAALALVVAHHPDVVLMDLRMPGTDGITATERLRAEHPEVAVVILTTYNEDELMRRGLRAGARGYLLKDTDRATLLDTIRAAARGETLLKPELVARLLEPPRHEAASGLTARELEVLVAVAAGARSKVIAHRLRITERTVKAHLTSIYNKLGVDNRAAAVAIASSKGWLRRDSAWE